jgi:WD40 repeat protein
VRLSFRNASDPPRVLFSPDGKLALSAGNDGFVWIWNFSTGKEVNRLDAHGSYDGHRLGVSAVAFFPGSRRLITGAWTEVVLWETASGKELRRFRGHAHPVNCLACSPDGRFCLSGANDSTLRLWQAESGREMLCMKAPNTVQCVVFTPDGRRALSCDLSDTTSVRLWDVKSGRELRCFGAAGLHDVHCLACSPDGRLVLAAGWDDSALHVRNIETGKELHRLEPRSYVMAAVFSADGRRILAVGGHCGQWPGGVANPRNRGHGYGFIALYDTASGREIRRYTSKMVFTTVAASADGRHALTGSYDGAVKLWRLPK